MLYFYRLFFTATERTPEKDWKWISPPEEAVQYDVFMAGDIWASQLYSNTYSFDKFTNKEYLLYFKGESPFMMIDTPDDVASSGKVPQADHEAILNSKTYIIAQRDHHSVTTPAMCKFDGTYFLYIKCNFA